MGSRILPSSNNNRVEKLDFKGSFSFFENKLFSLSIMSSVPSNKLGIAGSINALVRNLGMVFGISLATTLLYNRMSHKLGYRVVDYVLGQEQAFIYGMKLVYITAATTCAIGALLTAYRLLTKNVKCEIGTEIFSEE